MGCRWGNRFGENHFLSGGKVAFGGGWKIGKQEYVHGHKYSHWLLFDQGFFGRNYSRCKSFESITYNDTQNRQPARRECKLWPQKMSTGHLFFYRGVFLKK